MAGKARRGKARRRSFSLSSSRRLLGDECKANGSRYESATVCTQSLRLANMCCSYARRPCPRDARALTPLACDPLSPSASPPQAQQNAATRPHTAAFARRRRFLPRPGAHRGSAARPGCSGARSRRGARCHWVALHVDRRRGKAGAGAVGTVVGGRVPLAAPLAAHLAAAPSLLKHRAVSTEGRALSSANVATASGRPASRPRSSSRT